MFRISCGNKVPVWVQDLHLAFANWLEDTYNVKHGIEVYLFNNQTLPTDDTQRAWGLFTILKPSEFKAFKKKTPFIGLTGNRRNTTRRLKERHFVYIFAHEFCHYEQWRDGKPLNHRGLENRVNSLVRKFYQGGR
jgi:hypothetical protein